MAKVVWLLLLFGALALLAYRLGLLDVSAVAELGLSLPLNQTVGAGAEATSVPPPLASVTSAPAPTDIVTGDICTAQQPRFVHGLAALKTSVGRAMGDPIECERVIDAAGNTERRTTTGQAYYRAATNTTAFTNGSTHWALTSNGAVHWTGQELEPPQGAERGP
jgi:hypothetical protein